MSRASMGLMCFIHVHPDTGITARRTASTATPQINLSASDGDVSIFFESDAQAHQFAEVLLAILPPVPAEVKS